MYPGWRIWGGDGTGWHACRRGNFRQVFAAGTLLYAVHADNPAGLWARLITETDQEHKLPVVLDAGDEDYRGKAPSCPSRRVHAHRGNGQDGSTGTHLRRR